LDEHLPPEEMDESEERRSGEEPKGAVRRLLRGGAAGPPAAWQGSSPSGPLTPELSAAYDVAFDRAEEFARRAAFLPENELERFRQALSLLQSGQGVMALAKDGDMSVEGLGVYEALLARSWAVRYDDPREMCHLASVAVTVAEGLDSEVHGGAAVKDRQARAWGELANSYRVGDRLHEAEQAFGAAFSLARQGTGDPRLRMRLLDLEASLLGTQREFDLALPRLTALSELHHEAGDPHQEGRALVSKALYTFYSGSALEALRINSEALRLIDMDRDPSLAAIAAKNQSLFLVECGRYREARKILFKSRARFAAMGHIVRLRLRGIEGRIDYGVRRYESAEAAFREVKRGFEEAGMGFACALDGLNVAMTLMRQGRTDEAVEEVLQSAAMFEALSIHREVLGAVIFLEQEFRRRRGSLLLLESTVSYLRRKTIELGLE
jgi:tetratricopeptide (TPR) repeat protein